MKYLGHQFSNSMPVYSRIICQKTHLIFDKNVEKCYNEKMQRRRGFLFINPNNR